MLNPNEPKDRNLVLQLADRGVPVFKDTIYRPILLAIMAEGIGELVTAHNPGKLNQFLRCIDDLSVRSIIATWLCERAPLRYDADRGSLKKKKTERAWEKITEDSFDDLETVFAAVKSTATANADKIDLDGRVMSADDFVSSFADALVLKRDLFSSEDLNYLVNVITRVKKRKLE